MDHGDRTAPSGASDSRLRGTPRDLAHGQAGGGEAVWRAAILVAALAPSLLLAGNRTGVWLAQAGVVLVLLALRAPRPPQTAPAWAWLAVMGWAAVGAETWSIWPDESWRATARMGLYAGLFLLAAELARRPGGARAVLGGFAVWAAALSAYGMAAEALGANPLIGALDAYPGAVKASFVNRSAFALYAGFGAIAALARLTEAIRAGRRGPLADGGFWILCLTLCLAALCLTGSRGGIAATGVGLVVFALLVGAPFRRTAGFAALAVLAAIVVEGRFGIAADERFEIHRLLLSAIMEAPWRGVGAGAFQDGFRPIAAAAWRWGDWDHAHNAYLEAAFELGAPAAALKVAAVALTALGCARAARRRAERKGRTQSSPAPAAAGAAAAVAAGLHGLVDLSLAIPAVPAALALLLGAGAGRASRRRRSAASGGTAPATPPAKASPPPRPFPDGARLRPPSRPPRARRRR